MLFHLLCRLIMSWKRAKIFFFSRSSIIIHFKRSRKFVRRELFRLKMNNFRYFRRLRRFKLSKREKRFQHFLPIKVSRVATKIRLLLTQFSAFGVRKQVTANTVVTQPKRNEKEEKKVLFEFFQQFAIWRMSIKKVKWGIFSEDIFMKACELIRLDGKLRLVMQRWVTDTEGALDAVI